MFSGFLALSYLPLHDAIAIGYAAPLIVVVLAALVLKETVRAYRWTAVMVGFAGVLIMLSPHLGAVSRRPADCPDFGDRGALRARRRLLHGGRDDPGPPLDGEREDRRDRALLLAADDAAGARDDRARLARAAARGLSLLVLIGILGGIGQILLTQCYRFADTSIIAPFEYTTMIWALLLGWFVFGELPTRRSSSGRPSSRQRACSSWRERQLGLVRRKEVETASQRPGGG